METAALVSELIQTRQTILPKRLAAPGPSPAQLRQILTAASAAPDHGMLTPWRFVIVPTSARHRLAKVFEEALKSRDSSASAEQIAQAAEKAYRAPLLIVAIAKTFPGDTGIDSVERILSTGCALQNMLLMATAMGFGSALTSGKALRSSQMSDLLALDHGELAVCFLSIGTVSKKKPSKTRPQVENFVSTLADESPSIAPSSTSDTPILPFSRH